MLPLLKNAVKGHDQKSEKFHWQPFLATLWDPLAISCYWGCFPGCCLRPSFIHWKNSSTIAWPRGSAGEVCCGPLGWAPPFTSLAMPSCVSCFDIPSPKCHYSNRIVNPAASAMSGMPIAPELFDELGNVFIGIAPLLGGTLVILFLLRVFYPETWNEVWQTQSPLTFTDFAALFLTLLQNISAGFLTGLNWALYAFGSSCISSFALAFTWRLAIATIKGLCEEAPSPSCSSSSVAPSLQALSHRPIRCSLC